MVASAWSLWASGNTHFRHNLPIIGNLSVHSLEAQSQGYAGGIGREPSQVSCWHFGGITSPYSDTCLAIAGGLMGVLQRIVRFFTGLGVGLVSILAMVFGAIVSAIGANRRRHHPLSLLIQFCALCGRLSS